jgi:DNA-binding CsgD family transcriptional regulator
MRRVFWGGCVAAIRNRAYGRSVSSSRLLDLGAAVLPDLYALTPLERFPAHAARIVRRVVAGEKCDVTELDLRTGEFRVLVDPAPPQLAALADARRAYMPTHPLFGFLREPPPGAHLISDQLTRREFHRLDLYGEFFAQIGVEDQLGVGFVDEASGVATGVTVDRDRRSFDEHDRALLTALRPHLAAARRNAVHLSALLAARSTVPHGRIERLTARQQEVLAQVATGSTNAQIALALDISEGTVRKHLEHILRALEVTSRTAAAAIQLTAAATPPQPPWTATVAAFG